MLILLFQAAQSFDLVIEPDKSFMDYINDFQAKARQDKSSTCCSGQRG